MCAENVDWKKSWCRPCPYHFLLDAKLICTLHRSSDNPRTHAYIIHMSSFRYDKQSNARMRAKTSSNAMMCHSVFASATCAYLHLRLFVLRSTRDACKLPQPFYIAGDDKHIHTRHTHIRQMGRWSSGRTNTHTVHLELSERRCSVVIIIICTSAPPIFLSPENIKIDSNLSNAMQPALCFVIHAIVPGLSRKWDILVAAGIDAGSHRCSLDGHAFKL